MNSCTSARWHWRLPRAVGGFTFLEIMVVVAVLGVVAALVVPLVQRSSVKAKGEQETQNLRLLESAKRQWAMDNPGRALGSPGELKRYLPGGQMPRSPWGKSYDAVEGGKYVYDGIIDLDRTVVSPYNNVSGYELASGSQGGANEVAGAGVVYVEKAAGGVLLAAPSAMVAPTPPANKPPTVDLSALPLQGPPGTTFRFKAVGQDPEGGPVEYRFEGQDWGGSDEWVRPGLPVGSHTVTVVARDRDGLVSSPDSVVVSVVDLPPSVVLDATPSQGFLGESFEFKATAQDPEGGPLKYSFDGGVSWGDSPIHTQVGSERGPLQGRVVVRDQGGLESVPAVATVQVVNRPPTVALSSSPAEGPRKSEFSFTAVPSDPDGDAVEYSFDGAAYQGSPVLKRSYDSLGSKSVRVRVRDALGGVSSESLASVLVVNRPPIVTLSPSTQSVVRNQNFSVIADGIDPDGDVLTYRFRVGGGPWTSSPASFSGAASALGAYTVTVEASDGLGGTALASAQVLVGNQPPTVTLLPSPAKGFVGQPFIFTATGQDPEGDSLSYQFTSGGSVGAWGNATTFPWVADILGNKTVSVRVRDAHGLESDLVSATVLVENRAPVVSLTSYVGGVEQASGFRGTNFRFVAAGSDPDGDTSLSYLFEGRSWGSSQELFSSWAGVGNYTVKVWARDRHGLQSPPAVATVQVVNRPPTVTLSPSTQSVVRNQSFSVTAAGSDPDGDPLTYRFRVGSGPWASSPPTFSSSLSALGNYTVTVEASDGLGGTHQASAQVVVVNRPPTVTLSPSTQSIFPGQSFSVTAAGSDPDGDPLTYRFRVGSGPWASSPPTFSSSLSALGNYTVTVEASDGLGGIDQDSATVRVRDNNSRVTVVASPSAWGIPSGSGVYSRGSTATASVSPNYGYEFSSWEGISGQGTPYSFVVSDDVTLTGVLVPKLFRVKLETVAIVGGGTAANSYGLHADVTAYVYTSSGRLLGTVSSSATNRGNDASDLDVGEIYAPYGETIYVDAKVNVSSAMSLLALWNPGTRAQAQDGEDYSALNPDPNMARAQYYQERWSAWGSDSWSGTNLLSMVVGDWDGQYLGMVGAGTPLLVDLSGDGRPDLLGGGDWRLTPSRRPSADPSVYRRVNLGGAEADLWEWVGPSDGLLVYLPGLSGTPGASHLFGTQTFGKSWGHGFEPLATLDLNGDGVLRGAELDEVGVWVDANSDAQAQEGEIRKAQDVGLTQVSLEFVRDEFGNVSVEGGAELRGSQVSVWDWISYRYPKTTPENEVARWDWVNVPPSLEKFPVEVGEGLKKLEMSGGGTLRLHRIGGQLYMRATSAYSGVESPVVDFLFPARVVSPGVLEWGAGPVRNTLFASGLEFYGLTLAGADRYGVWSAKLLSGDLAGLFSPSSGD